MAGVGRSEFNRSGLLGIGFPMTDVTRILKAIEQGDAQATEDLLPLVYGRLAGIRPSLKS